MKRTLADTPTLRAVLAVGAAMTAVAFAFGVRAGYSTAMGAAIAAFDLYLIAWIVDGLVRSAAGGGGGGALAAVIVVKSLLLFSLVLLLASRDYFAPIPLLIGLGALPLGIVIGGLSRPPAEPGA